MELIKRTPIDDPVLQNLLLAHVLPYLQEHHSILTATVQSLTTAQSLSNRYVLNVVICTTSGTYKSKRLVIGKNGEIRNKSIEDKIDATTWTNSVMERANV